MAAAVRPTGALAGLLLAGCFHAPAYSPQRSVATWREMQTARAPTRAEPGAKDTKAGDALTAEQAYALALANNPELAVVEAGAAVAEAEIGAAKQLDNPTLRITNFQIDDTVAGRPGVNLGLRAPIPRPGTLRARAQGARMAAEAAKGETDDARRQLRARVYALFARMALLRADIEEVTKAAALRDERRKQISARVDRQVATQVDLSLAELAHAETVDETDRLRGELARTEAELDRVVGPGGPHTYVVDAGELRTTDLALDGDALVEQALRARPELRAGQTRVGEAKALHYLEKSKAWPWLSWAQVNYYVNNNSTASAFGFGLALDLPLLSWNRGEIRAAQARVRQRELEERAGVAMVAGEVGEALARVERASARVQEIEQRLLPKVEEAARQAEAALAAGALDTLAAGEIEARRVDARRMLLAAQFERRDAIIALEAAVGGSLRR